MALEIYLIRHAESELNIVQDKIVGRSNWAELTPNGILQSRALGAHFKKKGISFDAIYSSPAVRTQQTARYCFESMGDLFHPVHIEPALIEASQGDWEGKLREEIYSRKDVSENLEKDNWNYALGGEVKGESPAVVAQRMKGWLEKSVEKHSEDKIAAFTHGIAVKFLLADLFDLTKRTAYTIPIGNTGITIIKYENGKPTCVIRNDISHLEKAGLSSVAWIYDDPEMDKS